jgi:hypothetical protein
MAALVDDDVLSLFAVRGEDPVAAAQAVRGRVEGVADRVGLVTEAVDVTALGDLAAAIG